MAKPYEVTFAEGDVNKMVITPLENGAIRIAVYDGTHADNDDIIIQATVSRDELKKLRFAINRWADECRGCGKVEVLDALSRYKHGEICSGCAAREAFDGDFIYVKTFLAEKGGI